MEENKEEKNEVSLPFEEKKDLSEKNKTSLLERFRENPWILSTTVLGIFVLILLVANVAFTGNVVSEDEVGNSIVEFAALQGLNAEIVEVNDQESFYEVMISIQGQESPLYVTKDGKYLSSAFIPLEQEETPTEEPTSQSIPKSDNPQLELFVMTHCPYGTQAEKGFIPFIEAFGENVDAKIRFVHYFMHDPEETETPRQVCIREEQSEKYLNYLRYFLEEGDSDYAISKSGVSISKMQDCIDSGRADDYYAEDSQLSEQYGVQGSPTLVVNGQIVQSGRAPSAYLDTACKSFTEENIPEECGTLELSSASPSSMWGWDESSSGTTTAQC